MAGSTQLCFSHSQQWTQRSQSRGKYESFIIQYRIWLHCISVFFLFCQVSTRCIEVLASIQSILRPRGPTLNFAMEMKQSRSVQQEAPLLNGWSAKFVESSLPTSAPSQPAIAAVSIENPPVVVVSIDQPSTPPRRQIPPNSIDSSIEIRQPETSPPPSKRLSLTKSNEEQDDDFLTPPMGVTTISSESPVKSTRVMTRKEALQLLVSQSATKQSANHPKPKQIKNEASPFRKRPHENSKRESAEEKVSFFFVLFFAIVSCSLILIVFLFFFPI